MRTPKAGNHREWPGRATAAAILVAAAASLSCTAIASRQPLLPLRAAARWSLEWKGARFVASGRPRLQSSLYDCGPTALAEFLELSGLPVPSKDSLMRLTKTDTRGTTLRNLETAALASGLRVMAVQWSPAELGLLPVPALVWVDHAHFVVVARRSGHDTVEIHDPAVGHYRIAGARFARSWSGDALIPLDSVSPSPSGLRVRKAIPSPAGHAGTSIQNDGDSK